MQTMEDENVQSEPKQDQGVKKKKDENTEEMPMDEASAEEAGEEGASDDDDTGYDVVLDRSSDVSC